MKPRYYAIKTPKGYIANQGVQIWTQDTPKGWAAFCEPEHAQSVLDRTEETEARIVPIGEDDQPIETTDQRIEP